MAERVSAYPFPEPESYPHPVVDVEPEIDFGIASVPIRLYAQLSFRAGRTFRDVKRATQTALTRVKNVTVRMVEERPIHLVVGVAIATFIAGAGLRIWRSRHE
jgi:hypothetical protein